LNLIAGLLYFMDNRTDKIIRRKKIAAKTGGCDRCPPHAKENERLKGRKPRDDRHKNHRKFILEDGFAPR
jgi:hypothetical protein